MFACVSVCISLGECQCFSLLHSNCETIFELIHRNVASTPVTLYCKSNTIIQIYMRTIAIR